MPTWREVADHARMIAEADPSCAIILGADGRWMDGMHGVPNADIEGRETVLAVRLTVDPEPDFVRVDEKSLPYDLSP